MENEQNHNKLFTTDDIMRYHAGELSPAEMHVLERASLNDPMLADALEGFSTINATETNADLKWLHEKINSRSNATVAPIVPLHKKKYNNVWKVAAILILLAGTGTFTYFFLLPSDKQRNSIAKQTDIGSSKVPGTDVTNENKDSANNIPQADNNNNSRITETPAIQRKDQKEVVAESIESHTSVYQDATADKDGVKDIPAAPTQNSVGNDEVAKVAPQPVIITNDSKKELVVTNNNAGLRKQAEAQQSQTSIAQNYKNAATTEDFLQQKTAGLKVQNYNIGNTVVSGQVIDSRNRPVVGAVVALNNNAQNTFTDANGFFHLDAPTNAAQQQITVNSLGYETAQMQPNNKIQNQTIVLQDKNTSLDEVVVLGYGAQAKKSVSANGITKGSQQVDSINAMPANGWNAYNSYLYNSRRYNTNDLGMPPGSVELMFDVNREGLPTNIEVAKPLTDTLNKEAIRLLKEGPTWTAPKKKKVKKVKVIVPF